MSVRKPPWKVLIVDDSKADRKLYQRYLLQDNHQHYQIWEASYGYQCLEIFKQQKFDIILLDFHLPDMSGLQILSLLQEYRPHTAVIMLTGHGNEQVAVKAIKAGAQDYLVKGQLQKDILQATIHRAFHQAQLQWQLTKNKERQRLITQIAFQIRESLELEQTLETAVTEVHHLLQCDRVLAYKFSADLSGKIIAESVGEEWTSVLGQTIQDTYFQVQGTGDYCQGRKQIIADIYDVKLDPCHLRLLEQFEVRASLVTPIVIKVKKKPTNQLWGLLIAHQCSDIRQWQPDEIHLLDELSTHLSIAIKHAELLTQTKAALKKEKALNAFKSRIIATVSHEYNGPLTAIQTAATTLKANYQNLEPQTRERFLGIIEQKSKHMAALVRDMLLVNQAELNQLKLKPILFDVGNFLSQLIEEQQMFATDKHELSLKIRGNTEGFVGDIGLLRQLFVNLLSNAIKYSPSGGKVQIHLIGEASQLICQVRDEGIGIPKQDQKRLFQSFSRGSNVDSIAGTGLGLVIAKTAVELHGGTIDVKSQEGKETHVTVCLPKQPKVSVLNDDTNNN